MILANEGWSNVKLKDVSRIGDGAHASIERKQHGILYLSSKNFGVDRLDLSNVDYISERDYKKYFKGESKAITKPIFNDLLLGIIGTLGSPYLVKASDSFGLSSSVAIIRVNQEVIAPLYLYYWIKSPMFQLAIDQIKSGVAQSFLSLAMIGNLPCNYPNIESQKKIASVLQSYDQLIEKNLRSITILDEISQNTYEEWFIRLRFPEYESTSFCSVTSLPVGWKIILLSESCTISGGGTPSRDNDEYWEGGDVTWFSPTDLSKAGTYCILDSSQKITKEGLAKSSAKLMLPNSFMMTSRATIGLFALIDKPFSTNQGFINVTPHESWHKLYLFFNFKSRVPEFYNHASGATFPEISKSKFKKLKVNWPDEKLLKEFDERVSPVIENMMKLTKQNLLLKEARDILLPRLMTGMIDIDKVELPEALLARIEQ